MFLKKNGISYISSERLGGRVAGKGIVHAFLGRTGGVSTVPYKSLNFDSTRGDSAGNVRENTVRAASAFGFGADRLVTVHQVHGSDIHVVEDTLSTAEGVEADAIVTGAKGVPIGVLTADCLPALLHDPANGVVAAAHAGWKGTLLETAKRAVEVMCERFGSTPSEVSATLGPCIGPCCYTVGEEVLHEFEARSGKGLPYFTRPGDGTLRLDMSAANLKSLLAAGLRRDQITVDSVCTSCENDFFFSYRKEHGTTGRQLSFIMLA